MNNYKASLQLKARKGLPLANSYTSYKKFLSLVLFWPVEFSQHFEKRLLCSEISRVASVRQPPHPALTSAKDREGTCLINRPEVMALRSPQQWNQGHPPGSRALPVLHRARKAAAHLSAWRKLLKELPERIQLCQGQAWAENWGPMSQTGNEALATENEQTHGFPLQTVGKEQKNSQNKAIKAVEN